jgi:hypothetical protein
MANECTKATVALHRDNKAKLLALKKILFRELSDIHHSINHVNQALREIEADESRTLEDPVSPE